MKFVFQVLMLLMIGCLPGMSVGQTDIESVGTFGPAQLMFDGFRLLRVRPTTAKGISISLTSRPTGSTK